MIIDMHIHPIFYEAVCKDKEELEFEGKCIWSI